MASKPKTDAVAPATAIFEVSAVGQALRVLASAIERKNTIPILQNVHVDVRGGEAVLTVSNLDYWLSHRVPVVDGDALSFTASAHLLANLIGNFPNGAQAKLTFDGGKITVASGRSRYSLQTLPVEDWPMMEVPTDAAAFTIEASTLRQVIADIGFAMSSEETRFYLCGICMHRVEGVSALGFAATNGIQMGFSDVALPEGAEELRETIVQRKAVGIINRMIDGIDGPVDLVISKGKIIVTAGAMELRAKLVDGNYPPYRRIVPANGRVFEADADDFAAALARTLLVVEGKSSAILLTLDAGKLTIAPRGFGIAEGVDELAVEYAGDPFQIAVSGTHLRDHLSVLKGSVIQVALPQDWGASAPALIRAVKDPRATYVLQCLSK